jgi:guanine deaminase
VGLRVTTGLVVSDRVLRADLLSTPARAYDEGRALAERWHGQGRTRYAVTPRFSLSASEPMLESCASLAKDVEGTWFTSHVNENRDEVAEVVRLFEGSPDYVDTYDRFGLVGPRSVFAHNVHVLDRELGLLAAQEAWVAHCPSSNSALGSGLFPMRRHIEAGVRVSLGSDVGAGTGLSLLKEGLQAYFMQQLLGAAGLPLTSAHLLYLATAAGASALGLGEQVGDFSVGKELDAVWVRPAAGSALDCGLRNADSEDQALAKAFALGTDADISAVYVGGERVDSQSIFRKNVAESS